MSLNCKAPIISISKDGPEAVQANDGTIIYYDNQAYANLPLSPFQGMDPTPVHLSDYGNQEDPKVRSGSECSIWQQSNYPGSYRIAQSLSIENLPSRPYPCMVPKLLHRRIRGDDKK